MQKTNNIGIFSRFAQASAEIVGSTWAFVLALIIVIAWSTVGPIFNFSDTWQLVMNTTSSIVTFLIVFLLQNSQNRDTRMLKIKLDELINANKTAKRINLDLSELSDEQLKELEHHYLQISKKK